MKADFPSRDTQGHRAALTLTVGIGLIYLAFLAPGLQSIDNTMMLDVSISLVKHHDFSVPPSSRAILGRGGLYYAPFYPLLSIVSVPFVAGALLVAGKSHLPDHFLAAVAAIQVSVICTALSAGLVLLLAFRLGGRWKSAFVASLAFAFGTMAMVYSRYFYADPLLGLLSVAALYVAFNEHRTGALCALFCALAVLAKPSGIVLGPVLACYFLVTEKSLKALLPIGGTLAGAFLYAFFNWFRFGHASSVGQPWDFSFRYFPEALTGFMLSPGRGLFWFCPPIIGGLFACPPAFKKNPWQILAVLSVAIGYICLHSFWSLWYATWSWGPRLILPTVPVLCTLIGLTSTERMRRVTMGLAVLGFVVNGPFMFAFYERYFAEYFDQPNSTWQAVNWSFHDTPLVHGWQSAYHETRDALGTDVRDLLRTAGQPNKSLSSSKWLHVVALWWWMLPLVRISRLVGAGIALLLSVSGVAVIAAARRMLPIGNS